MLTGKMGLFRRKRATLIEAEVAEAWNASIKQWPHARRRHVARELEASQRNVLAHHDLLQPYLAIVDESIHFLVHLFEFAFEQRKRGIGDPGLTVLLGRLTNLCAAIRVLLASGFDQPARPLVRTLLESLDVATVVVVDPEFAAKFTSVTDDAMSMNEQEFWKSQVAFGRIHKRVDEIIGAVGLSEHERAWYRQQRRTFNDWLSGPTHASAVSASLSTLTPSLDLPGILVVAPFGALSTHTPQLLDDIGKELFRFGAVMMRIALSQDCPEPFASASKSSIGWQSVLAAYLTMQQVVEHHWDDIEHFRDPFEALEDADHGGA
jgi:hypothetical protein